VSANWIGRALGLGLGFGVGLGLGLGQVGRQLAMG